MFFRLSNAKVRTNRFFGDETEEEKTERERLEEEEKKKAPPLTKPKLFTQDEVNRFMKEEKDKAKKDREKLIKELEDMKDQGLTPQAKETLQARIDQLTDEGKTLEERTKDLLSKKDKDYAAKLDITEKEAKRWRTDYEKYRAEAEIIAAAQASKADNPSQIYRLLKSDVHFVEVFDGNGKSTGEFVPKIKLETVDKEGEKVVLDLTPKEAIKKMTEMEEHANLFNSGASGGLNGSNNGGSRTGNTAIPKDMNAYMKARKANPRLHSTTGKVDK